MRFFVLPLLTLATVCSSFGQSPSMQCRPDEYFENGRCVRLKTSLSTLVCDILEQSEATNSFLHYQLDANGNAPPTVQVPQSVPVSDLFIQNLAVVTEANMSSCLAWSSCLEQCLAWPERSEEQRQIEENSLEKFSIPEQVSGEALYSKSKDDDEDDVAGPDFVRAIMFGAKKGIQLSQSRNSCDQCRSEFALRRPNQCSVTQFHYVTRMNALYRKLTESKATLYDRNAKNTVKNLSPEALYHHYSMRFLELANLTSCFAQVSCENTCGVYRQTLSTMNVDAVSAPTLPEGLSSGLVSDVVQTAASHGYQIALRKGDCTECARRYRGCEQDKYEIAQASSQIFG